MEEVLAAVDWEFPATTGDNLPQLVSKNEGFLAGVGSVIVLDADAIAVQLLSLMSENQNLQLLLTELW